MKYKTELPIDFTGYKLLVGHCTSTLFDDKKVPILEIRRRDIVDILIKHNVDHSFLEEYIGGGG